MKAIYTVILSMFIISFGNAQDYYSDFEDDTLQNWTDYDGTTTGMSVQGEPNSRYLQKICDGTITAEGSMTIVNSVNYNGDYNCDNPQGINCFGSIEILTRNTNAIDLHLRIGFLGANGYLLASEFAQVVPANSDWVYKSFTPDASELIFLFGSGTIEDAMTDVQEFRIFHNPTITWVGAFEIGNLEIDYIWLQQLLDTNEFQLNETSLFPNPAKELLTVSLSQPVSSTIVVYNLLGQQILTKTATTKNIAIPVSELKSGVYLVRIEAEGQVVTRKFVKR